jgi:tRNA modification GTPase
MERAEYTDGAPIYALATQAEGLPPQETALALIRLSGEGALSLLAPFFSRPKALLDAAGNTIVHGWILDGNGRSVDEVLVSVFRAPKSYTGEEGADIACHGGRAVPRAVCNVLRGAGFRLALRGEFTLRAYVAGKLDLSKAESVLEMVHAKTDKARENAVSRLEGRLRHEIEAQKLVLIEALAGVELALDYSELDGVPTSETTFDSEKILSARESLTRLSKSYAREQLYAEGAVAVIAGRPNAGKSSLFNALLREERSIVTPIAGTTRDYIEARLDVNGIPLRLVDTAGLREDEEGASPIELIGIRRAKELMSKAALILYVVDCTDSASAYPAGEGSALVVINKIDLVDIEQYKRNCRWRRPVYLSAKTGEGIEELLAAISGALLNGAESPESDVAVSTERQKALVDEAVDALNEALAVMAEDAESFDLAAPALRSAIDALGAITGEVTTAAILDAMFSKFCVGK